MCCVCIYIHIYVYTVLRAAFTGWETLGGGNSPGALRSRGRQEIDYVIIAPVCGRNTARARVYMYNNIICIFE